jgi:hypothetical protein
VKGESMLFIFKKTTIHDKMIFAPPRKSHELRYTEIIDGRVHTIRELVYVDCKGIKTCKGVLYEKKSDIAYQLSMNLPNIG